MKLSNRTSSHVELVSAVSIAFLSVGKKLNPSVMKIWILSQPSEYIEISVECIIYPF